MKRNIRNMLIALVLLSIIGGAVLTFSYHQEEFIGSRVKEVDTYLLDVERMSATDLHTLELQMGDVLQIRFKYVKGVSIL